MYLEAQLMFLSLRGEITKGYCNKEIKYKKDIFILDVKKYTKIYQNKNQSRNGDVLMNYYFG